MRSISDALTVPSIAVIPELGGKKVFVYARRRGAAADGRDRDPHRIARSRSPSGLAEGDLVIITGILQLQPGLEVEIEEIRRQPASVS